MSVENATWNTESDVIWLSKSRPVRKTVISFAPASGLPRVTVNNPTSVKVFDDFVKVISDTESHTYLSKYVVGVVTTEIKTEEEAA